MEIKVKKYHPISLDNIKEIEEFNHITNEQATEILYTINNLAKIIYYQSKPKFELKVNHIQPKLQVA